MYVSRQVRLTILVKQRKMLTNVVSCSVAGDTTYDLWKLTHPRAENDEQRKVELETSE